MMATLNRLIEEAFIMDYPFTDDDMEKITAAYDVITRVGNQTALAQQWDTTLDRAQHSLGIIMAVRSAAGWRRKNVKEEIRYESS